MVHFIGLKGIPKKRFVIPVTLKKVEKRMNRMGLKL